MTHQHLLWPTLALWALFLVYKKSVTYIDTRDDCFMTHTHTNTHWCNLCKSFLIVWYDGFHPSAASGRLKQTPTLSLAQTRVSINHLYKPTSDIFHPKAKPVNLSKIFGKIQSGEPQTPQMSADLTTFFFFDDFMSFEFLLLSPSCLSCDWVWSRKRVEL